MRVFSIIKFIVMLIITNDYVNNMNIILQFSKLIRSFIVISYVCTRLSNISNDIFNQLLRHVHVYYN